MTIMNFECIRCGTEDPAQCSCLGGPIYNPSSAIQPDQPGAICFQAGGGLEVLRFEADGRVFVRGELVESNAKVYEAAAQWLAEATADPARLMNQIGSLKAQLERQVDVGVRLADEVRRLRTALQAVVDSDEPWWIARQALEGAP